MNPDPRLEKLLGAARELPRGIEPAVDLWPRIARELASAAPEDESRTTRAPSAIFQRAFLAAATVALVCAIGVWTALERAAGEAWDVAVVTGNPLVGARAVSGESRLRAGQWLETDSKSRARVVVGRIGQVSIDPNSRVRLLSTAENDHRLELARGTLHALILAPPRIFFVETPAATAVDLGCAYTITVDESGAGLLHVTSGYVALEHAGRETVVRAGMMCLTRRGSAPGTPFPASASPELRAALSRHDFGAADALAEVLAAAFRPTDARVLWHLLTRVDPARRPAVYAALARLMPPPPSSGINLQGIVAGDLAMLESWSAAIDAYLNEPLNLKKLAPPP